MRAVLVLAEKVHHGRGLSLRGDVLRGGEADLRPLVESGSAAWSDAPENEDSLQVDRTLWPLNVPEAVERVRAEDDSAVLRSWHTGELRNPKHQPEGRKSVRAAIKKRLTELRPEPEVEE